MQEATGHEGVYRIGMSDKLLTAHVRVLEAALPPILGASDTSSSYGLVLKGLPLPRTDGTYVVEFLDEQSIRVLAYLDPYGRAFTTDEPLTAPPARYPDLNFARFSHQDSEEEEHGCVEVRDEDGQRQAAQYVSKDDRYTFFDSWYDFESYGEDLAYEDALARAYLAFVHRPALGGSPVPARGIDFVFAALQDDKLIPALRSIIHTVRAAEIDPVLRPPALAVTLSRWLIDAGLLRLSTRGLSDDALRLVRTVRYANTFYVTTDEDKTPVTRREMWGIEGALNRFLLVNEALGDAAMLASAVDCARLDSQLIDTAASGELSFGLASETSPGIPRGEWAMRCNVLAALEHLRLPLRVEAQLRADTTEGIAALEITVPDANLMPKWRWSPETEDWQAIPQDERESQARRYAMHVGLALTLAAFEASAGVQRVDVVARPLTDSALDEGAIPRQNTIAAVASMGTGLGGAIRANRNSLHHRTEAEPAYYQVTFTRDNLADGDELTSARTSDPTHAFEQAHALFNLPLADAFAVIDALPSARTRQTLPEGSDAPIADKLAEVLGAHDAAGMRIEADSYRRHIGERLADRIVRSDTTIEAIHIVREEQDAAALRGDVLAGTACNRLMTGLTDGSLDTKDQNAIVAGFLGEDRCLKALGRARTTARHDPGQAVQMLVDAVSEASALDGFIDSSKTVYRSFDSYAARLCYNRSLSAALDDKVHQSNIAYDTKYPSSTINSMVVPHLSSLAADDAHRHVELVPDSFYLSHLEIVRLLEQSFDRTDEALRYGRRAVEIAPATAAGYRQLGRAFMLVGDTENAALTLEEGLNVAIQPNDIAMAYYQLAYVLWKSGDAEAGVLCYMKSLATSTVVAIQATAELHELLEESGVPIPAKTDIDVGLAKAGIPIAPTTELLDLLDQGAAAATDAGLFSTARDLLALRLRYRPDDALVNVLRSLES